MTTPLIIVWSVWFIPQTYSLLAMVPLIFLELHLVVIIIYVSALVMEHGGVALWMFIIIVFLTLINKILRNQTSAVRQLKKLILFSIIFILYFSYTTISMILKGAATNVFEALLKF